MTPTKIVHLRDKLQSWPGEMALTSDDIAALLSILAALERLDNPRDVAIEKLITEREAMLSENQKRIHLGQSLAYTEDAFYELARNIAALEEKGGVSEGERKEMLAHFEAILNRPWNIKCEICDKIRARILSGGGGAVTEEWIKETAAAMTNAVESAASKYGQLTTEESLAAREANQNYLERRLRAAGVAGKEVSDGD